MSEKIEQKRLLSLDVFRGITIAGMILVNNPGDWGAIYSPFEHAEWNGWTPTDLIFPFFLFIVGIVIPLALGKRVESGGVTRDVYLKIFRRSAVIFLLGLLLNALPFFDFVHLRIPGVLQRIAVCYLIASLIFLRAGWKQIVFISAFLLILYWILMTVIPVPGCAVTSVSDKACNLSAYIDRQILGVNHIWSLGKVYDPEGILSTLPAIVTALAGVLAGFWLKTKRDNLEKVGGVFFFGVVLTALGWMWNFFFPINKALWTSSYVVFTAGMALCFFGFCYWLIDIKNYQRWSKPFVIFGVNALALYVLAETASKLMDILSIKEWIFQTIFAPLGSPKNASLMFAVSYIFFWLFIMWLLYRKRIFIKV
ncbi:MAG: DUF5009 domain-containing protein [Pyrinomonadaceae bacterium]